jgi:hypothetical protein
VAANEYSSGSSQFLPEAAANDYSSGRSQFLPEAAANDYSSGSSQFLPEPAANDYFFFFYFLRFNFNSIQSKKRFNFFCLFICHFFLGYRFRHLFLFLSLVP